MKLTKTDFIQYSDCQNSLWLLKNKPKIFEKYKEKKSLFLEKLIKEGYEFEKCIEKKYSYAKDIGELSPEKVKEFIKRNTGKFFQAAFETKKGAYTRVDILDIHEDGTVSIYEIKSSSYDLKKGDKSYDKKHFKDLAFQKYILEENGYIIKDIFLIYLNKQYVKKGELDLDELIHIGNVTNLINDIFPSINNGIEMTLNYINKKEINENLCTCLEKTKANHCNTFEYFNEPLSKYSIYELSRISPKKIIELRDMGISKISDIPEDYKLSENQRIQKDSVDMETIIDEENIRAVLNELEFPLYFFDYETLPFAIPKVDGYWPHAHLPTQFSLHVLDKNGALTHHEYLAEKLEQPLKLIEAMREYIGNIGTLISWNKSYEQGKNKEMLKLFPKYNDFLLDINSRTFDLMEIFKKYYTDKDFHGSISIKSVLPVLVPKLSYKDLEVQDGSMAVSVTEKLFFDTNSKKEKLEIRKELLEYCKLDTLAMVKIYKALKEKIK